MFFNHDHPFEELFCICLVVVNKTWRDMRATVQDFAKVFSVVREQITRVLSARPSTQEVFKERIAALTYAEITDLWQQERTSREKFESKSRPIMELRQQIEPEISELIQQQRLGYLTEGTRFSKYTNRGVFRNCTILENEKTKLIRYFSYCLASEISFFCRSGNVESIVVCYIVLVLIL